MKIKSTKFTGLKIIQSKNYRDSRGFFKEDFKKKFFKDKKFVFGCTSSSNKNVIRGLHLQTKFSQGKYVSIVKGGILDVAVDLRKNSKTFGKHFSIKMSHDSNFSLYIPEGFAHGYYVISETAEIAYKCSDIYHPEYEQGIRWDDPEIGIEWPGTKPLLSERDINLPMLHSLNLNREYYIEEEKRDK